MKSLKWLWISLIVFPSMCFAQRYDVTADIGKIRYHEATSTLSSTWRNTVWISMLNLSVSPVNCKKYGGKYLVSIPADNETALSMVLAAKMANKKVQITLDDPVNYPTSTTYCKLQYVTIL